MDDIVVFGKSTLEVKMAAQQLTKECRKRKLFLNTQKTRVLQGRAIAAFLDKDQDDFVGIDYDIDTGQLTLAKKQLKALMGKVFKKKEIDEREYKFLLNRLRKLSDPSAIKKIPATFKEYPQLADVSARYLKRFVSDRPSIATAVLVFLRSEDNIYPWQEMWLLRILFECTKLDRNQLNCLRQRVQKTDHWINKSLCLLLMAKYGDAADLEFCWQFFGSGSHTDRAVVLCCQPLTTSKRLQRCNEATAMNPDVACTSNLVKGANKAIWPA